MECEQRDQLALHVLAVRIIAIRRVSMECEQRDGFFASYVLWLHIFSIGRFWMGSSRHQRTFQSLKLFLLSFGTASGAFLVMDYNPINRHTIKNMQSPVYSPVPRMHG